MSGHGDAWQTALAVQARQIQVETGSIEKTAAELVRKGATDEEVRELFYPDLTAQERRLLDNALQFARADAFGTPLHRPDPDRDPDWLAILDAYGRWSSREGNADQRMDKQEWLEETRMGRDRFDAALRRHDVRDVRHLESRLRAGQF